MRGGETPLPLLLSFAAFKRSRSARDRGSPRSAGRLPPCNVVSVMNFYTLCFAGATFEGLPELHEHLALYSFAMKMPPRCHVRTVCLRR